LIHIFCFTFSQSFDYGKIPVALKVLQTNHIAPINLGQKEVDDMISDWLLKVDEDKWLFTKEDLATIKLSPEQLFDKAKLKTLCSQTAKLYQKQMKSKDSLISKVLKYPFNTLTSQAISNAGKDFCSTKKEKQDRIIAALKWQVCDAILSDSISISKSEFKVLYAKEEAKQRAELLKEYERMQLDKALTSDEIEAMLAVDLLNAICLRFDPHSEYFSSQTKNSFQKSLSKETLMFGFSVTDDKDGKPIISSLKAGGAAWKTGEINSEDEIVKIEFVQSHKTFIVKNESAKDINDWMEKYGDNEIYMTVKKKDGEKKRIYLTKQLEAVDENVVSSYLLIGKRKLAYMALPAFYTDFDPQNVNGSANDIAKEIVKLKRNKIEGFILDLRNNGGGSIEEAVNIAGIFINEGPLAQIKYKQDRPVLVKDLNRGFIFDGPMIVLVNHLSASASEFLSMILQDYNRAIIVGTPTYGKASGQSILPMIENFDLSKATANTKLEADDYIKTTILKIYNVDGQTYQGEGVQPDVFLPDVLMKLPFGEKYQSHFLKPDALAKKVVISPFPNDIRTKLKLKQYGTSDFFKKVDTYSDSLLNYYNLGNSTPASIDAYYDQKLKRQKFSDRVEAFYNVDQNINFTIDINDIDKDIYKSDEDRKLIGNKIIDLQKDPYIKEAYQILEDIINP
jgi:carboxyl-terminal processing protease